MSIRFRRSMKIAPGLRLNFSKSTLGLSFGVPGARVSVNTKGDVHASAGIPGTGLYAVERRSLKAKKGRRKKVQPSDLAERVSPPSLFASSEKKALYRAIQLGSIDALRKVGVDHPKIKVISDAFILPKLMMSETLELAETTALATNIWNNRKTIETSPLFVEYSKGFVINLNVAPGVSIPMQYGTMALGLSYVELLQLSGRHTEAIDVAESLPPNQATAIAVCESELQLGRWKDVLDTTDEVENVDEATALLLIYRAIALREQGMIDAAIETLRRARSSKKRNEDVLNKALFERAICYEKQGKKAQARKDLEKILSTDSDFPGLLEKLKTLSV